MFLLRNIAPTPTKNLCNLSKLFRKFSCLQSSTIKKNTNLVHYSVFALKPFIRKVSNDATIPTPPIPPEIIQSLNSLGEPTFASLGLNSYWPSGWYQALLECIHVNLELPWWFAIASTTLVIRMSLLPLIIDQRRKLSSYSSSMPKLMALQDRMSKARLSADYIEMLRVSQQMQELMKNKDLNPLRSMRLMFIQVPIFLSVFSALRQMALLPVESIQTGGLGWFMDLTVCDPYYILPLYSMTSIFLMLEFGVDVSTQMVSPVMRLAMRGFPVIGFFMIMHMPSALLWYWSISNTISIIQALVLRTGPVRKALKFPENTKPLPMKKSNKGFVEEFRETFRNSQMLAELEARERLDGEKWQKAGTISIPKTFSFDPTTMNSSKNRIIDVKGSITPENIKK